MEKDGKTLFSQKIGCFLFIRMSNKLPLHKRISLSAGYALVSFGLLFLLYYPVIWVFLLSPKTYRYALISRTVFARMYLRFAGVKWRVEGAENIPANKKIILAANHDSYLDIPILMMLSKDPVFFVAKAELLKIPLFGKFFKTVDVPVVREDPEDGRRAFEATKKKMLEGYHLAIFPEGGIKKDKYILSPLKSGVFRMAEATEATIVPVYIHGTAERVYDDGEKTFYSPGPVTIRVGKPLVADTIAGKKGEFKEKIFELAGINK
jgi:1-acyl-sn-glycerol-3-phosphate acyltransferase